VGRSTFYTHFADKEELLAGGFDDLRKALRARRGGSERLGFVRGLAEHIAENLQVARSLIGKRAGYNVIQELRATVTALVRDDLQEHGLRGRPLDAATHYLSGAFMGLLTWWVDARNPISVDEFEHLFRKLTLPVLADARSLR
jgi:AcrR family transcriptional regulator